MKHFSKTKFIVFLIVLLVPITCYLIISYQSDKVIVMPKRLLYDTVIANQHTGEKDTIWHQLKDIQLVNQFADTVNLHHLRGKTIIFDFFFTRCPSICPSLTKSMYMLQESIVWKQKRSSLRKQYAPVHFISISIDPERDTPDKLLAYANTYRANHDVWWFLTGEKQKIYQYVINELKLGLVDGQGVNEEFIHSDKFVLVDKHFNVRGYYSGLDTVAMKSLSKDIGLLILEKE